MSEYERSRTIEAPADAVFAFVAEPGNLHDYLPPIHEAHAETGERVHLEGEAQGHEFSSEGFMHRDDAARRIEWGSEVSRKYSGWMQVQPDGERSQVSVHLDFGPRSDMPEQAQAEAPGDQDPLADGIDSTLATIARLVEGSGGRSASPQA